MSVKIHKATYLLLSTIETQVINPEFLTQSSAKRFNRNQLRHINKQSIKPNSICKKFKFYALILSK
jgi:hypothetical protein